MRYSCPYYISEETRVNLSHNVTEVKPALNPGLSETKPMLLRPLYYTRINVGKGDKGLDQNEESSNCPYLEVVRGDSTEEVRFRLGLKAGYF